MTLIAIPVFPRFTALDAVGPYEVLQRIPSFDVVFVGHRRGEVRTENGMLGVSCDAGFDEVGAPDVVVVPGGIGTRQLIHDEAIRGWLQSVHRTTTFTTSVCTGALLLAAAGLVDGLTATTHWRAADLLNELGALRGRPRRGAPPAAHRHRGGGFQRHRHGVASGRAPRRSSGRAGQSTAHRIRPAAAIRFGGSGQGGRGNGGQGPGVSAIPAVARSSQTSRISSAGPPSGTLGRWPTQATLLPRNDRGRADARRR